MRKTYAVGGRCEDADDADRNRRNAGDGGQAGECGRRAGAVAEGAVGFLPAVARSPPVGRAAAPVGEELRGEAFLAQHQRQRAVGRLEADRYKRAQGEAGQRQCHDPRASPALSAVVPPMPAESVSRCRHLFPIHRPTPWPDLLCAGRDSSQIGPGPGNSVPARAPSRAQGATKPAHRTRHRPGAEEEVPAPARAKLRTSNPRTARRRWARSEPCWSARRRRCRW